MMQNARTRKVRSPARAMTAPAATKMSPNQSVLAPTSASAGFAELYRTSIDDPVALSQLPPERTGELAT